MGEILAIVNFSRTVSFRFPYCLKIFGGAGKVLMEGGQNCDCLIRTQKY